MRRGSRSRIAALVVILVVSLSAFLFGHFKAHALGLSDRGALTISVLIGLLGWMFIRQDRLLAQEQAKRRNSEGRAQAAREEAARHAEQIEWLQMTEALAHVGHWRMRFADNNMFWSDETFRIHGWPKDRPLVLEDALDVYHPEDRDTVIEAVEKARTSGRPYSFRARILRPDGEMRHVEAVAKIENGEEGDPVAMFGVFADRTEEQQMLQALKKASQEAFAAARAKSTFLATMSHEIRTPMNGIVGFTDLLLRSDLQPQQRQFAEIIAESSHSMMLLLNDILDLSKIDAGEMKLSRKPTDIVHLLRRSVQLIEPQARKKGLALELDICGSLPRSCMTDPLRLRQVLSNLLGNAVKFTDHGYVSLSAEWANEVLTVVVRDSGPGIAQEEHDYVFGAFAQATKGSQPAKGGTGLGLAISRQLATLLDGELTLASKLGEGCAFTFSIAAPAIDTTPKASLPEARLAVVSRARKRVLVAEDYDINQMLVEAMAQRAGIDCVIAPDGGAAFAMVEQAEEEGNPFALVLMDLQMPEVDGFEAANRLRANGFGADRLPIVAMTANAFPEDIARCLDVGMQDHLAKPVTYESFCDTIDKWLPPTARAA